VKKIIFLCTILFLFCGIIYGETYAFNVGKNNNNIDFIKILGDTEIYNIGDTYTCGLGGMLYRIPISVGQDDVNVKVVQIFYYQGIKNNTLILKGKVYQLDDYVKDIEMEDVFYVDLKPVKFKDGSFGYTTKLFLGENLLSLTIFSDHKILVKILE